LVFTPCVFSRFFSRSFLLAACGGRASSARWDRFVDAKLQHQLHAAGSRPGENPQHFSYTPGD